jgi:hypothetical protein
MDFQGETAIKDPPNNADSCDLAEMLYDQGVGGNGSPMLFVSRYAASSYGLSFEWRLSGHVANPLRSIGTG